MGFELISMNYDSVRMLNPLSKIKDINDEENKFMFNRIPYNFSFTLYIGAKKFEDSLKIIEQIVPLFTPDLNLTIQDKVDFNISTDVPFILNNVSLSIDYQGSFENRRVILWQLDFTCKAYLYSNTRELKRIKETISEMGDSDFNAIYRTLINEVSPRSSGKNDNYIILEEEIDGPHPVDFVVDFYEGIVLNDLELAFGPPHVLFHFNEFEEGIRLNIIPTPGSL